MKTTLSSFSFHTILLISVMFVGVCACDLKEEDPVHKIYKAKPLKEGTIEKKVKEELIKKEILPSDKDSLVPSDSTKKIPADTTESLHRQERKPSIKSYKRIYYYNLHRKSPIA
ncbi:MAG: hypothetical protein K2X86_18810 [Cytophagaceae bacterium]|nr:hypothetical protein [Cytophagaceae bacterium]